MADEKKVLLDVEIKATEALKELAQLKIKSDELKVAQKQLDTTTEEGRLKYEALGQQIKALNVTANERQKTIQNEIKNQNQQQNSIQQLKAELSLNTKAYSVCLLFGCTSQSNRVEDVDALFANADSVILKIVVPTFCGDTFNISNFGAREDADAQTNKAAINAAIDSANVNGGGVVFVPEGKWLTGPITLKSNVNLHVSSGSTLIFSTVYEDYLPA